jgi:hypothetical protein
MPGYGGPSGAGSGYSGPSGRMPGYGGPSGAGSGYSGPIGDKDDLAGGAPKIIGKTFLQSLAEEKPSEHNHTSSPSSPGPDGSQGGKKNNPRQKK